MICSLYDGAEIADKYVVGAKIVCRCFSNYTDEGVLHYISDRATKSKEA